MSTLALNHIHCEHSVANAIVDGMVRWRRLVIAVALGYPIFFYTLLLAVLVVRYGELPNYLTPYNWPSNVWRIIESTGSVSDMVPIIGNEWLIEIGRMNFEYGNGIADWSMAIVPHKLLMLALTGALIGLNLGLLFDRQESGNLAHQCLRAGRSGLLASAGALSASVTSATIFSIACCATPSWVGSFAVLGVETASAFALEPYGPTATILGIVALIASAFWIASDRTAPGTSNARHSAKGTS